MASDAKLMHAIWYDSYGGGAAALKRVETPVPTSQNDEVLIKLEASSINPIDFKVQNGLLRPIAPSKFPFIPVTDIAGEVVKIGSDIKKFKTGDKVVAKLQDMSGGGLAEYAVAKENLTVARPPEVSMDAAALVTAGLTALQALTESALLKLDKNYPEANVLITAASGGVGHYAVQLAKLGNIHVTATCGARNFDFVKNLGADEVIDYKTPEGAAVISPSGRKYDAVINCTTGISWSTFEPQLKENGTVVDLTPGAGTLANFALKTLTFSKKKVVPFMANCRGENLEYLVTMVKQGKVKSMIDSKYLFSKAEDAWTKIMSGHAVGKIIIEYS
ncbi:hypothetical protein ACET3Z_000016 [Daucus carota]